MLYLSGDNKGAIIQGQHIEINSLTAPIVVIVQEKALYIINRLKNVEAKSQDSTFKEIGRNSTIVNEIISSIPPDKELCLGDFVKDRVAEGQYSLFQSYDENTNIIEILSEYADLERYGLKILFETKDGIMRIRELGRFYYKYKDSCLKFNTFKDCEGYDFATDFSHGTAIVGNYKPKMSYNLIDKNGKLSDFSFIGFEESFMGFEKIIKISLDEEKFVLVNRNFKILTEPFSEHDYENINGFLRLQKWNDYSLYSIEDDLVTEVISDKSEIEYFGSGIFFVRYVWTNYLLDSKNSFKSILPKKYASSRLRLVDTCSTGFEFTIGEHNYDDKNGFFVAKNRKIIKPEYYSFDCFNLLEVVHVFKKEGNSYKNFYLDINGEKNYSGLGLYEESEKHGLIVFQKGWQKGCLDLFGRVVVEPKYSDIYFIKYTDLALLCNSERTFLFDTKNHTIKPFEYPSYIGYIDSVFEYSHLNVLYIKSSSYNYIVDLGNLTMPISHHEHQLTVHSTNIKNLYYVTDSNSYNIYIKNGQEIHIFGLNITDYKGGNYAIAKCIGGGVCYIDSIGNPYPHCLPYDSISEIFNDQFAVVTSSNKKGIINISSLTKNVPIECDKIEIINNLAKCYLEDTNFTVVLSNKKSILDCVSGDCEVFISLLKRHNKDKD